MCVPSYLKKRQTTQETQKSKKEMIEEVLDIINDSVDDGSRLNRVVDEFRDGRDTKELLNLLDSKDSELVATAVWILGELPYSIYNTDCIIKRLKLLLKHDNVTVRFYAIGALYPAFDATSKNLLIELQSDSNEGVRLRAKAAIERLGLDSLSD